MENKTKDDSMFKVPRVDQAPSVQRRHLTISFPVRTKISEKGAERRMEWSQGDKNVNGKSENSSGSS
ncbi:unnamed protein product [Caenorhabditis nigoni]